MDTNNFAGMIAVARQDKKMTQEELATRLGVTPQAVSKWERGIGMPDISMLNSICEVLQVSADDVLKGTIQETKEEKEAKQQNEIRYNACAEPLLISFGSELIPCFVEGLKTTLIATLRKQLAAEQGLLIPTIRIRDEEELEPKEVYIKSYDKILYHTNACEINAATYEKIMKQLFECAAENYEWILNKEIVKMMIDTVQTFYPGVVADLIPDKISYLLYEKVLASILHQGGSIRNHIKIIEHVENEMLLMHNSDIEQIARSYIEKN